MDSSTAKQQRFAKLTGPLTGDLYRYAFWLSRDPSRADDLVQDTLLRAWKALDSLRDEKLVKHWLFTILRRENARTFERKQLDVVPIDDAPQLVAPEDDAELGELRRAIYELEDDYREPLVLQVMGGYTAEEIGQIIGIKPGAVLTRLFRARKKLMEIMNRSTAVL